MCWYLVSLVAPADFLEHQIDLLNVGENRAHCVVGDLDKRLRRVYEGEMHPHVGLEVESPHIAQSVPEIVDSTRNDQKLVDLDCGVAPSRCVVDIAILDVAKLLIDYIRSKKYSC